MLQKYLYFSEPVWVLYLSTNVDFTEKNIERYEQILLKLRAHSIILKVGSVNSLSIHPVSAFPTLENYVAYTNRLSFLGDMVLEAAASFPEPGQMIFGGTKYIIKTKRDIKAICDDNPKINSLNNVAVKYIGGLATGFDNRIFEELAQSVIRAKVSADDYNTNNNNNNQMDPHDKEEIEHDKQECKQQKTESSFLIVAKALDKYGIVPEKAKYASKIKQLLLNLDGHFEMNPTITSNGIIADISWKNIKVALDAKHKEVCISVYPENWKADPKEEPVRKYMDWDDKFEKAFIEFINSQLKIRS